MPPSEDLMETFLDIDGIEFRDCIDGLDEDRTLNPAALDHPKGLSADHDYLGDNERGQTPFLLEESYHEDSLSDSSSSKRASSEASSSKSSGSSGELMADDFGDGQTICPDHSVIKHGPPSNPRSPLPPKMGNSFATDAFDHDDFMNDFLTTPSPEGMDLEESSPEAEMSLDSSAHRRSGAGAGRRANGHVKNESVGNFWRCTTGTLMNEC